MEEVNGADSLPHPTLFVTFDVRSSSSRQELGGIMAHYKIRRRVRMARYKIEVNLGAHYATIVTIAILGLLFLIIIFESPWKMLEQERQGFWLSIGIAVGVCMGIALLVYLVYRPHLYELVSTNEIGLEYRSLRKRLFIRWDEVKEVKREPAYFIIKTPQQRLRLSLFFQPEDQPRRSYWSYIDYEAFPWADSSIDPKRCDLLQEVIQKAKNAKIQLESFKLFSREQGRK
jgi:hypothetical protein